MKPLACLIFLLVSSAVPALADNPAMGPYGSSVVWGPEITSPLVAASVLSRVGPSTHPSQWNPAMQAAGICWLMFLADGSGVKLSLVRPGGDCIDGPVISFPEFRRRMEAP